MKAIAVDEFVRRLQAATKHSDSRFSFFLGAGCSRSSGIPTAAALVQEWLGRLKELKTGNPEGTDIWAQTGLNQYDPLRPSLSYGEVIENLFVTPQERQREIERIVVHHDPGFGYAVLAQLMSHDEYGTRFNMALTTNFDDLIADALYLYTDTKPLVIYHESLISFVRLNITRPTIIKLHGDARLEPKNTELETRELKQEFVRSLQSVLYENGLIFIGYAGNDMSIARALSEIPTRGLPWGIYWVNEDLPGSELTHWLDSRGALWVTHLDFDALMLAIREAFGLEHPTGTRFERLINGYFDTLKRLQTRLRWAGPDPGAAILDSAIEHAADEGVGWWSVDMSASRYAGRDNMHADAIYREGLRSYPGSAALHVNYAGFKWLYMEELDEAQELYEQAVGLAPDDPQVLASYAAFLGWAREQYDEAEELFEKATALDGNSGAAEGMYAEFLWKVRGEQDEAEQRFRVAVEKGLTDPARLASYAGLLLARGEEQRGFEMIIHAVALDGPAVQLECNFYTYAHSRDRDEATKLLGTIKRELTRGLRVSARSLEMNVAAAVVEGHPSPDFLHQLGKVLVGEDDVASLDKFAEWGAG